MIGGFASRLLGSPSITNDLDICYARDMENLERLANALTELEATLRGSPSDIRFLLDAKTLEIGDHFTFFSSAGALDILGTPSGFPGYEQLERNAEKMDLDGIEVLTASIDDLIGMKTASGRPKDKVEVEVLGGLREEIDRKRRERRRQRRSDPT